MYEGERKILPTYKRFALRLLQQLTLVPAAYTLRLVGIMSYFFHSERLRQ
jgi:hypothetical protein